MNRRYHWRAALVALLVATALLLGACGQTECHKQPNKKQIVQYALHNTKVEKTLIISNKKLT